ncbi:chloride channel protein [Enterococcus plantarum]|uniref:chloride channel protein n=1 Tax=Enterococcus plantarum TaxID=1077675 RepID=UPI001A902DF4|nr:chloride channel protein [Enterococcus plantarum]MBO0467308.1 chloride channel protein [Enterococcus plantarum]
MNTKEIGLLVYGVVLSSMIGVISFIFLRVEGIGSELLWNLVSPDTPLRVFYILGLTLTGGVLLGFLRARWGNLPHTVHDSVTELKQTKTLDHSSVFRSLLIALVVLIFGAGVGPEAGLLSAVIYLSVWQADKLRYYYFHFNELEELSLKEQIARLFHPKNYLLTYDEKRAADAGQKSKKKFFYLLFIINGLITFFLLMKLTGQPSFISKMGESNWIGKELWIGLPLMLFGVIVGKCYLLFKTFLKKRLDFWHEFPIRKALIGSIAIFLIGVFLPNLLFSGQLSLSLAPFVGSQASFLVLTMIALIKLVFLQLCLNTGWIGGDIFPIVFAAIIQGFAVSQLFPQTDRLLIVAIVSTSIAIAIINSPFPVGVFMMLFFPLNLSPIILAVATILFFAKKGSNRFIQKKTVNQKLE